MELHSFLLLAATAAPISGGMPLSRLAISLDTDRAIYWVGEPVRLTLKVANEGGELAAGYFQLWGEETEIYIRHGDRGFEGVSNPLGRGQLPRGIDVNRLPSVFKPGESQEFRDVVVMNARTRDLLLATPGEYEIKVRCWPLLVGGPEASAPVSARSGPVLESNAVRIRVDSPPSAQTLSLSEYQRDNLTLLVQSPVGYSDYDVDSPSRAMEFIERHPHGPYSEHVRKALLSALRHRVNRNKATSKERDFYNRLEAEAAVQR
jgi:hypothetical protein